MANLICSVENCGHLAERTGLCATHSREARKKAAPKEKPRKTRISKTADPERQAIYHAIKALWIAKHPICEVHGNIFPDEWLEERPTDEPHHKEGKLGDLLFDVRKWLPVCRKCHEWIERNPTLAYQQGWSLLRNSNEPHTI